MRLGQDKRTYSLQAGARRKERTASITDRLTVAEQRWSYSKRRINGADRYGVGLVHVLG